MKLDKIKFGLLCGLIVNRGAYLSESDVEQIDAIIDIDVPGPIEHHCYPKNENVEALMKHMAAGTNKIDAIREHRAITGMGLKESKEAVERYWDINRGYSKAQLLKKLDDTQMSAECRANIDDFLTNLK